MTRALLIVGVLAARQATTFEFAGLSRAITLQYVATRYPHSTVAGSYVYVAPEDVHDHIFGIELFGPRLSNRLRISFGSPDRRYPPCEVIERRIAARHGPPSEVRAFLEEAAQSRHVTWQLASEIVHLQCFSDSADGRYSAEAISVYPKNDKPTPSHPGAQPIRTGGTFGGTARRPE